MKKECIVTLILFLSILSNAKSQIGIGTSSPTTDFEVSDSGTNQFESSEIKVSLFSNGSSSSPRLTMYRSHSPVMQDYSSSQAVTQDGDILGRVNFGGVRINAEGGSASSAGWFEMIQKGEPTGNGVAGQFQVTTSNGLGNRVTRFVVAPSGNIGIGTENPNSTAALEISSSSKGFLPPRLTQSQIGAITDPANGLIVFCTTDDKFYAYITSQTCWREVLFGSGTILPPCGYSFTVNHVAGSTAPVTKTVTYNTVANIPGETSLCWIASNLGSDHQAAAVDDATEASAGWYWQFNRQQGFKHDGTTRTPNTSWITEIDEDYDWLPANDPCSIELGYNWRLPTDTEYENIKTAGGWNNWNGPWSSDLKLHAAGWLDFNNGNLVDRGAFGDYYSSTQYSGTNGIRLGLYSTDCVVDGGWPKESAFSVRCVREP